MDVQLNTMLKNEIPEERGTFGDPEYEAVNRLSQSIITPTVLYTPENGITYSIDKGENGYQFSADVLQTNKGGERKPSGSGSVYFARLRRISRHTRRNTKRWYGP